MPWIFDFEKSEYEANSQTELLPGPPWKNVSFSVSFMIVFEQPFAWDRSMPFYHISLFKRGVFGIREMLCVGYKWAYNETTGTA